MESGWEIYVVDMDEMKLQWARENKAIRKVRVCLEL